MTGIVVFGDGRLLWGARQYRCAVGKGGVRADKREGDGATPAGRFQLRRLFWRADRLARPVTRLPIAKIDEADGWCDDPSDRAYNTHVRLPYPARHETLWRADGLYDLVAVIGYNDDPPHPNRGSAIFMHVASARYDPTEGCVALARDDLIAVLADCGTDTMIDIRA